MKRRQSIIIGAMTLTVAFTGAAVWLGKRLYGAGATDRMLAAIHVHDVEAVRTSKPGGTREKRR